MMTETEHFLGKTKQRFHKLEEAEMKTKHKKRCFF